MSRPLVLVLSVLGSGCASDSTAPADDTDIPTVLEGCDEDAPELRDVQLGEVRLDYACQGSGAPGAPVILMLHGFPEFWMGWAPVMDLLAADHMVVAPDQRGYNTSDKPEAVEDYAMDHLVGDVSELIDHIGGPVVLVGHDWGGGVAWAVAHEHPEKLDRLVIMNAPHVNIFADLLANDPDQQEAFSYVEYFTTDGFEDTLTANDFAVLSSMFSTVLTDDELTAYKEAWGQERAVEGGLNWYRANFDEDYLPKVETELTIDVPTKVIWGMEDTALLPQNMDGLDAYVSDLEIVEVPGATHWIAHEESDIVAGEIADFIE